MISNLNLTSLGEAEAVQRQAELIATLEHLTEQEGENKLTVHSRTQVGRALRDAKQALLAMVLAFCDPLPASHIHTGEPNELPF